MLSDNYFLNLFLMFWCCCCYLFFCLQYFIKVSSFNVLFFDFWQMFQKLKKNKHFLVYTQETGGEVNHFQLSLIWIVIIFIHIMTYFCSLFTITHWWLLYCNTIQIIAMIIIVHPFGYAHLLRHYWCLTGQTISVIIDWKSTEVYFSKCHKSIVLRENRIYFHCWIGLLLLDCVGLSK